jgi:hypothetical protein
VSTVYLATNLGQNRPRGQDAAPKGKTPIQLVSGQTAGDLLALIEPQTARGSPTRLPDAAAAKQIRRTVRVYNPSSRAVGLAACPARNRPHTWSTASGVNLP